MSKRSNSTPSSPISNTRRRLDFTNDDELDGAQQTNVEEEIEQFLQECEPSSNVENECSECDEDAKTQVIYNQHIADLHTDFGPDLAFIDHSMFQFPELVKNGQRYAIHLRRISEHLSTFPQKCQFIAEELKNNIIRIHRMFLSLFKYVRYSDIDYDMRHAFYCFLQGANNASIEVVEGYVWLLSAMNVLKCIYQQVYPLLDVSNPEHSVFFDKYDSLCFSFSETAINIRQSIVWDFENNNVDTSPIIGISQMHVIGLLSDSEQKFFIY